MAVYSVAITLSLIWWQSRVLIANVSQKQKHCIDYSQKQCHLVLPKIVLHRISTPSKNHIRIRTKFKLWNFSISDQSNWTKKSSCNYYELSGNEFSVLDFLFPIYCQHRLKELTHCLNRIHFLESTHFINTGVREKCFTYRPNCHYLTNFNSLCAQVFYTRFEGNNSLLLN